MYALCSKKFDFYSEHMFHKKVYLSVDEKPNNLKRQTKETTTTTTTPILY